MTARARSSQRARIARRRALLARIALLAALPAGPARARPAAARPAGRHETGLHARMTLQLDPATRRLSGQVEWRLPAGPAIAFTLDWALRIDDLQSEPAELAPRIDHDERGRWRIRLGSRARESALRVAWSGTLAPLDPTIDHRRVLGTLPPMLSTEGGWLPAGSAWYPEPGVAFTYRVAIDAGAKHRALVPGRIVEGGRLPGGAGTVYASHNAEEGLTLMSGPWIVTTREPGASGMPRLLTWFTPATQALAEPYLDAAAAFISRFAKRMGPYPFDGFSIVAAPLPAGFALPGLTWVGERLLPLPFMRGQSLAHEIAHNWWGNGVRVDASTGNWSEGLVTWLADHALRVEQSPQAARRMRWGWLREQATLDPRQDLPLSRFLARTHGASSTVGYGRSAMLFHMVAAQIGEPAFDRALRALMESHLGRPARWQDLQSAFERAAGQALDRLIPPMVALTGAPALLPVEAHWSGSSRRLRLRFAQPVPYAFGAPMRLHTSQGPQDVRLPVAAGADHAQWVLASGPAPISLQFDLQCDLWRGLAASEQPALLRDVLGASQARARAAIADSPWDPVARSLAARMLEAARAGEAAGPVSTEVVQPLMIVGSHADLSALAAREPALARPATLGERAEVELWAARTPQGAPRLLVAADTPEVLERLAPRLVHYGGEGHVSFRAGRVVAQGVGAYDSPVLPVVAR